MSTFWSRARRLANRLVLAVLVGFLVFCVAWRIDGGHWERVDSPSMGTRAPVGSLLWVKPVDISTLQVGDLITFRPPNRTDATYSHAVHRIHRDGTITTKGAIPAPDPWRLTADDIVGKAEMTWIGVGWIVLATPMLVIGGLLVGAVWSAVRPAWKTPVAMVGGSIVVTCAIVAYRPLLNAEQISAEQLSPTSATATYVGVGVLPVKITCPGGDSTVVRPGEVRAVSIATGDGQDRILSMSLGLSRWWWIVVVLAFLTPGLRSAFVNRATGAGVSNQRRPRSAPRQGSRWPRAPRRRSPLAAGQSGSG